MIEVNAASQTAAAPEGLFVSKGLQGIKSRLFTCRIMRPHATELVDADLPVDMIQAKGWLFSSAKFCLLQSM